MIHRIHPVIVPEEATDSFTLSITYTHAHTDYKPKAVYSITDKKS